MVFGRVYIIRSYQTTDVYIGSTTQILCKRFIDHKQGYKRWLNGNPLYITSYEIVKYEDCYIELIEEKEYESKQELHKQEGHFIREMECVNKLIAGRTNKERLLEQNDIECLICNFKCKLKSDYGRHLKTESHTIMITKQNEIYHYIHYKAIHQKKLNKLNTQFLKRALIPRLMYELKEKFII